MHTEEISLPHFTQAIRLGDLLTAKELLKKDSELASKKDEKGFPPIILAAYNDQSDVLSLLLEHGADIDARDNSGNTALMGVCFKGYKAIAKQLIDAGADVNAQNLNEATALTYACTFNRKEMAELLLQQDADPNLKDIRGNTPADHARMQGLKWADKLL